MIGRGNLVHSATVVCRVGFYFRLGSIPNGADPMVEWLVVFLYGVPLIEAKEPNWCHGRSSWLILEIGTMRHGDL